VYLILESSLFAIPPTLAELEPEFASELTEDQLLTLDASCVKDPNPD
jgi:hypothetical protein